MVASNQTNRKKNCTFLLHQMNWVCFLAFGGMHFNENDGKISTTKSYKRFLLSPFTTKMYFVNVLYYIFGGTKKRQEIKDNILKISFLYNILCSLKNCFNQIRNKMFFKIQKVKIKCLFYFGELSYENMFDRNVMIMHLFQSLI